METKANTGLIVVHAVIVSIISELWQDAEKRLGQGSISHTVPRCYGLTAEHFNGAGFCPLGHLLGHYTAVCCTGH